MAMLYAFNQGQGAATVALIKTFNQGQGPATLVLMQDLH